MGELVEVAFSHLSRPRLSPSFGVGDCANMPRTTTILALLQTVVVIVGFISLGAVLKISGYPDTLAVRWNPLAVFLREHEVWLLLLPVLWVAYATSAQRLDRAILSYRIACVVGLCIAAVTIVLFLYAAVFPYTRPFFLHVR